MQDINDRLQTKDGVQGQVDIVDGEKVVGWARDNSSPDKPFSIQIIVDGKACGKLLANKFRKDLQDRGIGNGCYGFVFPFAETLTFGRAATIAFLMDNGSEISMLRCAVAVIGPTKTPPQTSPKLASQTTCQGSIDVATTTKIAGWALDENDNRNSTRIRLFHNGNGFADIIANQYRPDLHRLGIGEGFHGFNLFLIDHSDLAMNHVFEVRRQRDGAPVYGSPLILPSKIAVFDKALEGLILLVRSRGREAHLLSSILAQADRILEENWALDEHSWTDQLEILSDAGPPSNKISKDKSNGNILIVSDVYPNNIEMSTNRLIASHIASLIRCGWTISFIATNELAPSETTASFMVTAGVHLYRSPFYRSFEDLLRNISKLIEVVYFFDCDTAIAYVNLTRHYLPHVTIWYNTGEVPRLTAKQLASDQSQLGLAQLHHRAMTKEATAANLSDIVITHSPYNLERVRETMRGSQLYIVRWDTKMSRTHIPFEERNGVCCVGDFGHKLNLCAVTWLLEVVMPIVWRTSPATTITIAGAFLPRSLMRLVNPRVVLIHTADTEEVQLALRTSRLSIMPSLYGEILGYAFLESCAVGVPCAMTSEAARHFDLPWNMRELVGEGPDKLAEVISRLYADIKFNTDAAASSVAFVEQYFRPSSVDNAFSLVFSGTGFT